ncbi:TPA: FAD-dependent thymidylate synthase [Escherichia coli]|nr:FAD-dependent thymidylate synthase [Escherichia coli]HCJ8610296.1 FAD-dependent thymidylate synthase [Escherichia coli]
MNKEPSAKIIADSVGYYGGAMSRLTTIQLRYPRLVHSEFNTHRVFSRNASSSRAIPVAKMIEQVRNDPAAPYVWTTNKPGMQGDVVTDPELIAKYDQMWIEAANQAADNAEVLMGEGLHKQVVNRILEPFQWISVIVTATEWANWFELRNHKDADPTIKRLAEVMLAAMEASTPKHLEAGEWHLPYVSKEEKSALPIATLVKISAARCARVSYLTHDGEFPDVDKDIALYERLVGSRPLHASPIEHQARVINLNNDEIGLNGNFSPLWVQHRKLLETERAVA